MATVVLSTIGGLFGGQIGSRIGASIGKQIDAPAREGPRIKELDIQTSSYGNAIPAIFGTMRIAGTVIWATDIIERSKESGGKGSPKTTEYSYSVSFAVALSSRPALRVGRIWADGKLLRGAAGDFKSETQFRFYNGFDDQKADPLIASQEGVNVSPAFRGICYAVFEDMQLADYGNRIPSLNFELVEREAEVGIRDIAAAISPTTSSYNFIDCDSAELLSGYAMQGLDAETALTPLVNNLPIFVRPFGGILQISDWSDQQNVSAVPIIAASQNGRDMKRQEKQRNSSSTPETLALRHYDPARDYEIGIQRSELADSGQIAQQIDLPASISAEGARRLADLQLLSRSRSQTAWSAFITRGETQLRAGDRILEPGSPDIWQIQDIEHFAMASRILAQRPVSASAVPRANSDSGRNLSSPDFVSGTTRLFLMDLPIVTGGDPKRPLIAVAAASTAEGWRRASLFRQTANGLEDLGVTARPAIIGTIQSPVAAHSSHVIDDQNTIFVQLLNIQMELAEREVALSDLTAPVFFLAGEIIRVGRTDYQGNGLYKLSHLQRGCFDTQDKIAQHDVGESIIRLEADSLRLIEAEDITRGSSLLIEAIGLGDEQPVIAELAVQANATTPRTPVHGDITKLSGGDLLIQWIRRNRIDYGWQDGVDQPLDEDRELYQIDLVVSGAAIATLQTVSPQLSLSAAQIAAWSLASGQVVNVHISQVGRFAKSDPLMLAWSV